MNRPRMFWTVLLAVLAPAVAVAADDAPKRSPKEALQAFNDLIGSWRGSGEPNGTREEKQKGFWQETHRLAVAVQGRRRLAVGRHRQGQVLHLRRASLPARRRPLSAHDAHADKG